MRPLTSEELEIVFKKLANFIGENLASLLDNNGVPYVFRFHRDRVYYIREDLMKMAERIPRKQLISVGVCFGKFSKSKKFRLVTTSLDYLALYARNKVWLSSAGEQSYVYGNHVIKRHLGRITERTPKNTGVVIFSPSEVPLGFGVTAKSSDEMRAAETEALVIFHQSDIGEYLRDEADLV